MIKIVELNLCVAVEMANISFWNNKIIEIIKKMCAYIYAHILKSI